MKSLKSIIISGLIIKSIIECGGIGLPVTQINQNRKIEYFTQAGDKFGEKHGDVYMFDNKPFDGIYDKFMRYDEVDDLAICSEQPELRNI